jgi:hypothetical protein
MRTSDLGQIRGIAARLPGQTSTINEKSRVVLRESAFDCVLEYIQ